MFDYIRDIKLHINVNDDEYILQAYTTETAADSVKVCFRSEELEFNAAVLLEKRNEAIHISMKAGFERKVMWGGIRYADPHCGYVIELTVPKADNIIASHKKDHSWTYPRFNNIPHNTQGIIAKYANEHRAFIPLCSKEFKAQFYSDKNGELCISVGADCVGYCDMEGDIAVIATADTPEKAVEKAYKECESKPYFKTPPRTAKPAPDFVNYVGWCTWDAFYHDVTHDKIRKKMDEFKQKNIKIGWVMIDDGWFPFDTMEITDIYADTQKFPYGIKGTVDMLKNEYGVKYVGIWHSFSAYWRGIKKGSKAHMENAEYLTETKGGYVLPNIYDEDKAFGFFDKWHTYLKNEGIDFVKIDTQGSYGGMTRLEHSGVSVIRTIQAAVEKSVHKSFNDMIINCMAMGMENAQSRPYTSLIRNSDDFFPDKPESFKAHAIQNVYNALFNNDLYYLDFDMWWTDNEFAKQSAVLRAISGGPVYISDKVGETNPKYLLPLMDSDGAVKRCEGGAVPSVTCIYEDFENTSAMLKAVNHVNDTSQLAIFNFSDEPGETEIVFDDIMHQNAEEYIAYFYFEKKYYKFNSAAAMKITLSAHDCELINFYPIKDGRIMLGDTQKYISAAYNPQETDIKVLEIETS